MFFLQWVSKSNTEVTNWYKVLCHIADNDTVIISFVSDSRIEIILIKSLKTNRNADSSMGQTEYYFKVLLDLSNLEWLVLLAQ